MVLAYVHLWVRVALHTLVTNTELANNVEYLQMVFFSDAVKCSGRG